MPGQGDNRFRNWTFVVYPDSAPDNWQSILNELHVECYISPLHTDLNPDDSEKKPHWHCALCFEGKKSYSQVCDMIAPLNCTVPKSINSLRGMLRYFCHLDNPEKVQYSPSDVVCLSGADYFDGIKLASDDRRNRSIVFQIIREGDVRYYCDLIDILEDTDSELLELVCRNTFLFSGYIKDRRYKFKDLRGIKE